MTKSATAVDRSRGRSGLLSVSLWGPLVVAVVCTVIFSIRKWQPYGWQIIFENGPVEMTTFVAFIVGGVLGLVAARTARRTGLGATIVTLLYVFSIGWLFAGMEEVSWGQSLWEFATPAGWAQVNLQDETNIHNMLDLQYYHPVLLFIIACGGILFTLWGDWRRNDILRVPAGSRMCLAISFVLGAVDVITDHISFGTRVDTVIGMLEEVNEMTVSIFGLMFAAAVLRRVAARANAPRAPATNESPAQASPRAEGAISGP
jgi:hypothetical protein